MLTEKLLYLEGLKAKVEAAFPQKEWDQKFIEDLKLALTYHSNKIEGNTLTYGETIKFLATGLLNPARPGRDYLDTKHHQEVLDQIFSCYDEPITVQKIKSLHFQLMRHPDQWTFDSFFSPGQYKMRDNYVVEKSGKLHTFLPYEQVQAEMEKMVLEVTERLEDNKAKTIDKHPVAVAAYFHHKFVNIHPFEDGNGRLARIVINIILLKNKIAPFVIQETEREAYFEAIQKTSDSFLNPTTNFFADKVIESMEKRLNIQSNTTSENFTGI